MVTFRVARVHHALCGDAPLYGGVVAAVEREALVYAPAHRAVVYDDVLLVHSAESVALVCIDVAVAHAEAEIAYYDVVGTYLKRIVGDADAVAGGCLSGYGDVAAVQLELRCEVDGSRHVEDYGALAALAAGPAERTFGVCVFKCGDVIYGTAASAGGVAAETFGTGESGQFLVCVCSHSWHGCCRKHEQYSAHDDSFLCYHISNGLLD